MIEGVRSRDIEIRLSFMKHISRVALLLPHEDFKAAVLSDILNTTKEASIEKYFNNLMCHCMTFIGELTLMNP
jgi:hypothetical protein